MAKKKTIQWVDKFVERKLVNPHELVANPLNHRQHSVKQATATNDALAELGWVGEIKVNRRTGRLFDGHLRLELALKNGQEVVPVNYYDLSPSEEALALSVLDQLTTMATIDQVAFDKLLHEVMPNSVSLQVMLDDMAKGLGMYLPELEKPELITAPKQVVIEQNSQAGKLLANLQTKLGTTNLEQALAKAVELADTPPPPAPRKAPPPDKTDQDSLKQIDLAEQLNDKWQCQPGQLWLIPTSFGHGHHKLLIGDCTNLNDVQRLLWTERANLIFTSPPYAMQRKEQYGGIETANYVSWWQGVQATSRQILASDGSFLVNIKAHADNSQRVLYVFDLVLAMVRQWEWLFIDELCWVHQGKPGGWPNRLKNQFEPIYHFATQKEIKFRVEHVMLEPSENHVSRKDGILAGERKNPPAASGFGGKRMCQYMDESDFAAVRPGNVINISLGADHVPEHAAIFPSQLATFIVKCFTDELDIVYDPFCGSGTSLLVADSLKRLGRGMEILPKYGAVILQRLQDKGLKPVLSETHHG